MKRIILKMGVLGVFCLVAGCSDDGSTSPLQPVADNDTEVSSSDKAVENSSSSAKPSSETSTTSSESKGDTPKDTVIHEKVILVDSAAIETSSYVSSGVFCWNAGCEKDFPESSSSAPKSSEDKIVFTESSASNDPPTVEGNTMKDNRDDKTYQLKSVGGKLWMAEDLAFDASNSMCFANKEENCTKYGRLYTYNAATRACPAGWRLPNREEAQAALNAEDFPWSYGGRCKGDSDCGFTGEMGFHWVDATPQNGDKNFDTNTGDSYTVIIVEKEPEYAGDNEQKFFQVDEKVKHFSVRCVQD